MYTHISAQRVGRAITQRSIQQSNKRGWLITPFHVCFAAVSVPQQLQPAPVLLSASRPSAAVLPTEQSQHTEHEEKIS